MNNQSSASDRNVVTTDDSEDGNEFAPVQVINELRERISELQCELQHLKRKKTGPIDSLYQDDLNKIKTDMKKFSNTIQSTDGFFKNFDKKNIEISNELTALKRKVNKSFDEEKDLGKLRNELFEFLKEGMSKLQNKTEQLDIEMKNIQDGLKDEHEQVRVAIQRTKDLLKNSEQKITETSNEVKSLKEDISNGLLVRAEALDGSSFVKNEDLSKLGNGVLNVCSKGIEQEPGRSKQQGHDIKNVESAVQSKNSLKNQCKDMNENPTVMENSIKQFSVEIRKLQTELKTEQQKNIILENKFMTLECHLKEILINDINQNCYKEVSVNGTPVTNTSSKKSVFVAETNKLRLSDSKPKKPSQLDMQSKLLTHDFELTDVARKGYNDVNLNEEEKSKYVREGIDQLDNNEQECRNSLPQKAEDFSGKESSTSVVYSQADDLNENQCADLAFDFSSGKDGDLSYLEKAHAYLQNLQMAGTFTFSNEESLVVSEKERSAQLEPGNDTKKRMCSFTFYFTLKFSFYTPLKTSDIQWFSKVFKGYRKEPLAQNEFITAFKILAGLCMFKTNSSNTVLVNVAISSLLTKTNTFQLESMTCFCKS